MPETNLLRMLSVGYKIDANQLNMLKKELTSMGRVIASPNMQLYRAKKFRDYTVKRISSGSLELKKISEATKIISGGDHPPEYRTGGLLEAMSVRPSGKNAAEAGYFSGSAKIPGKNITYTKAAILQHTGYRIPLFGEKGRKVIAFLKEAGVFDSLPRSGPRGSKRWLIVPARPFLFTSLYSYMSEGEDMKAVDEFLEKLVNSPGETTMGSTKGEA